MSQQKKFDAKTGDDNQVNWIMKIKMIWFMGL